jgi:hypothetical protein
VPFDFGSNNSFHFIFISSQTHTHKNFYKYFSLSTARLIFKENIYHNGKVQTHQSLSNAVKQLSMATNEGSIGSELIMFLIATRCIYETYKRFFTHNKNTQGNAERGFCERER